MVRRELGCYECCGDLVGVTGGRAGDGATVVLTVDSGDGATVVVTVDSGDGATVVITVDGGEGLGVG
jgi:hypothetical protein